MDGVRLRRYELAILAGLVALSLAAAAAPLAPPRYDLFLRSDYGEARVWIDTRSGDFRWKDATHGLDLAGTGTLDFPNLGPMVFHFAGPLPGYDWVSISLKVYGTTATGYLAAFPEGTPVRKVVSNFYDKDTRDDRDEAPKPRRHVEAKPQVGPINPRPTEVPAPPPAPKP